MDGLSLVLPAYNEEAGLREAIAEADDSLAGFCGEYEILVVDDGSRDATAAIVADEASRRPRVRLLRHPTNEGYGAALRTGFEAARFPLVAFTDADRQFHLDDLARLLPLAVHADIVTGWRIDRKDSWRRCFLSRGYNLLARGLLGTPVRDIDCALKVFRREALARILPASKGFFANTEMLTRAGQLGLRITEIGVRHRPREHGASTVSLADVPRTLSRLLPFWWTRALFGGEARPRQESLWPALVGGCAVLLVACLLFFARLRVPLLEPQEARYAEIPRQMLAEGRWLVPTLHGKDYLDKPPLLYWLVMFSYELFGPRDWAARLVPGLAGVLTVLATLLWGWRAFGPRAGVCGAAVLCLLPEFVYRGRMLGFDVVLALWTTAALGSAWAGLASNKPKVGWWLLSGLFCGLGLLTKGPLALLLVAGPLAILLLLDERLPRPGWTTVLSALAVAFAVAVPWFVAVMQARPEFAGYFFWRHNVMRFVAPFDHARPWWTYFPQLALGLMPWTLLLPVLAWHVVRRPWCAARKRPPGLGFVLVAFAFTFAFFSLAGSKRPSYLLPALPPLALALGWLISRQAPAWRMAWARGAAHAELIAAAGLVAGACCAFVAVAVQFVPASLGLTLAGLALAGLALIASRPRLAWTGAFGLLIASLYLGVAYLLPAYNDQFSVRGEMRRQARLATPGSPVVCYPQQFDSASFYLPGRAVAVFGPGQKEELSAHLANHPGSLVLVRAGRAHKAMLRALPPGVCFVTGRTSGAILVGRAVRTGKEKRIHASAALR